MRSSTEIQTDIETVSRSLREIHDGLGRLLPVAQGSPIGREILSERSDLLRKLEVLKVERMATITTEFEARPRRVAPQEHK
jgi:hypothetical protein